MFYYYIRIFNWISSAFGLIRPFDNGSKTFFGVNWWSKMWSIIIMFCLITQYVYTSGDFNLNIKKELNQISNLNEIVVNISIILIDLFISNDLCIDLYETIDNVFRSLKIDNVNLKWISLKIYFWFSITTIVFLAPIIIEIIQSELPLVLIIKIPTYLTVFHLFTHLYLILSILTLMRKYLSNMLGFVKINGTKEISETRYSFKYLLEFNDGLKQSDDYGQHFQVKQLCSIYDDINVCMKLLEQLHGLEILLVIWQMFSSTVTGVTLIACKQAKHPWLVVVNCMLPFTWCFMGCFVDDQLRGEVEQIDTILVKHLISYRCDQLKRNLLQNFKQLVSTARLDFTAFNLFNLNYSMMLGTIVNIITYSIILIQLFVTD